MYIFRLKECKIGQTLCNFLNNLPYITEINIIGLRGDVGKVSLGFQGTNNTFFNILNEKGYKLKQVNDEFILIKK